MNFDDLEGFDKIRILVLSSGSPSAAPYADDLAQAGFDVVHGTDMDSAVEECRRYSRPVRAALIIDDPACGQASHIAQRLCETRPGMACVLLPSGVPYHECEIAIRTALRWTSRNAKAAC